MRTPITLQEFLFTLNQDEDILIKLLINEGFTVTVYKSEFNCAFCNQYRTWFVKDFATIVGGIDITIVELESELNLL